MPMYVVLVSIIVTLMSFFLFRKAAGDMSLYRLNIVSVTFYLRLVGMIYLGLTLSFLGVENYTHLWASKHSLYFSYVAVSYTLIVMPLSMICFQKYLFGGHIKNKINRFYYSELRPMQSPQDSTQIIFWGMVTIICALAIMYIYVVTPTLPIFALLSGESLYEVSRLRSMAKFEFSGNIYVRNLLAVHLTPIVSYISYGYYKLYGLKKYRIWFVVTFILSFFALTFWGEKSPIIIYIITLFIINGIINKGLSKRLFLFLFILSVVLIMLLYSLLSGNVSLSLYAGPLSRIIMVPSAGLRLTFDVFPELHQFLYGASFPDWMISAFGVEHERSARILMEIYNRSGVEENTAGVINSLFIAEAWANFGLAGIIISPILVGFVVQFIHNYLSNKHKTPVYVALMAYFIFEMPILGGFVDFIWNVGWIFLFVVIFSSIQTRQVLLGTRNSRLDLNS